MIYIVLIGLLLLLSYLPQLWIRRVMKQNSQEIPELQGTGGELAVHLIERFGLQGIKVEETAENQDHFDPEAQTVRLSPSNFHGKSLKAVAVAAHEVGHAMQFYRKEEIFKLRAKYIPQALKMRQLGVYVLWASPVLALVLRTPLAMALPVIISIIMQIIAAMTYLVVLPEEWDASFGKALPILKEGYVPEQYMPQVESVLKAAAFTYFAAALSSMLNLGYFMLLLRR